MTVNSSAYFREIELAAEAKRVANEEVRRLGVRVAPYVVGRIVEVVRAVLAGHPPPPLPPAEPDEFIDLEGEEITP